MQGLKVENVEVITCNREKNSPLNLIKFKGEKRRKGRGRRVLRLFRTHARSPAVTASMQQIFHPDSKSREPDALFICN